MFHHIKTLESKKFSVSFDLRDEGYEQDGTDGQLIPQVSIWDKRRNVYDGRWDVTKELGNHIYTTLKDLAQDADVEAVVLYIGRALDEGEDPTKTFKVRMVAGSVKYDVLHDLSWYEAQEFCENNNWIWTPDGRGGFEWDLEIVQQI